MGQRARRAKAQAIQAKLEGRTDYVSQNWRAPKVNKIEKDAKNGEDWNKSRSGGSNLSSRTAEDRDSSAAGHTKEFKHDTSSRQATSKDASGPVHASWAAKQAQQTGIVAFQGKKITFD